VSTHAMVVNVKLVTKEMPRFGATDREPLCGGRLTSNATWSGAYRKRRLSARDSGADNGRVISEAVKAFHRPPVVPAHC
jgi:hypothetical protein